jgi:hypothetical protein
MVAIGLASIASANAVVLESHSHGLPIPIAGKIDVQINEGAKTQFEKGTNVSVVWNGDNSAFQADRCPLADGGLPRVFK